jgi:polyisoprenyl-phosphate glycosyltransferase
MISVVVPVYKSASTLAELHRRIGEVAASMNVPFEIVYVNDASPDHSLAILRGLPPATSFHIVDLKKNIGQSGALMAGMAFAQGSLIATMDADLQDEPEELPELIRGMQSGVDVVFAKRQGQYEDRGRLFTSYLFKGMVHWFSGKRIPMNAGLFMLIKKDAVAGLLPYLPYFPYLIGLIAKTRLRCTAITVQRSGNAFGETSYTFRKRLRVAKSFFRTLRLPNKPASPEIIEWLNSHLLADHSYIAQNDRTGQSGT